MRLVPLIKNALRSRFWRAGVPLASNVWHLMVNRPDPLAPFYISWLLSYRCNCRCGHCDWGWSKNRPDLLAKELSPAKKLEVADQIGRLWTWGVSLSGGEPLLDPTVVEIMRRLKAAGKVVNLCTNGVLLEKWAEDLVELKVDTITVSFDSHHKERHDRLRGVRGTFDRALSGLKAIRRLRNGRTPALVVKGVISSSGFHDLIDQVAFFKQYADSIGFQPIQDNFGHQVKDRHLLFSHPQENDFRRTIQRLISKFPEYDHPYYRYMADYIFHPDTLLDKGIFRCLFSSSMFLGIDPYGNVGGCLGRFSCGNVRDASIRRIWRSHRNWEIQQRLRSPEDRCICWNYGQFLYHYILPIYQLIHRT